MSSRLLIPALIISSLALAACGKQGELDRPAPLFGTKAQAQYEAEKRAAARAKTEATDSTGNSQGIANSPYPDGGSTDPALAPSRTSPTLGQPPNPAGTRRSGGVLPDPYANPNTTPR
jgi:predicted small lipoprotein YifL